MRLGTELSFVVIWSIVLKRLVFSINASEQLNMNDSR